MGRRLPLRRSGDGAGKEAAGDSQSGKKRAMSSSGDESDGESGGRIALDRSVAHEQLEVTFEFNDMKDAYSEGITTLLKWLLPSHKAYDIACRICQQGIQYYDVVPNLFLRI